MFDGAPGDAGVVPACDSAPRWENAGMRVRMTYRSMAASAAVIALAGLGAAQAAVPESTDPIRIVVNNWTS